MRLRRAVAIILTGTMFSLLVGCGNDKNHLQQSSQQVTEANEEVKTEDPLEVLNNVWNSYQEEDKFAVMGGDFSEENMTENAPGKYSVEDGEAIDSSLGFPEASIEKIDSAASITHMMNANTFTCGAFHVANDGEVEAVAAELKENILNRQWMCGFPEKLVIVSVGDCVVSFFGHNDPVETFKNNLIMQYPTAKVISEDAIE